MKKGVEVMGKIDDKKQIKLDSLLDTTFKLFTTKGILKTSISDIVENAGVAKGTFYLYFKDKYDIRNKLISHKSSQLFRRSIVSLEKENITDFEDKIMFIVDNLINQLNGNPVLLNFIAKNLSWGIFKTALTSPTDESDINFRDVYYKMICDTNIEFIEPEIMLFLIVELVSSTCYSSILYKEPVDLVTLKPHLYETIRTIINNHKKH